MNSFITRLCVGSSALRKFPSVGDSTRTDWSHLRGPNSHESGIPPSNMRNPISKA